MSRSSSTGVRDGRSASAHLRLPGAASPHRGPIGTARGTPPDGAAAQTLGHARAALGAGRGSALTTPMGSEAAPEPKTGPRALATADRHADTARRHAACLRAMRPWYRDAPAALGQRVDRQTSERGQDVPSVFEWLQAMWRLMKHTFLESWHRGRSTTEET
jgi:hypothetical protein